jgi:hypothetical protein
LYRLFSFFLLYILDSKINPKTSLLSRYVVIVRLFFTKPVWFGRMTSPFQNKELDVA